MTNFEWIKQQDSKLKRLLINTWGLYNGNPKTCNEISCSECNFCSSNNCIQDREAWLESTHESKYKQGDVVVTHSGQFWVVQDDSDDELSRVKVVTDANMQNHYASLHYSEIAAKIGSIEGIELKNEKDTK